MVYEEFCPNYFIIMHKYLYFFAILFDIVIFIKESLSFHTQFCP